MSDVGILTLDQFDYRDKTVICRVDINSPLDPKTKKIVDDNRIVKSLPTIRELNERGARLVLMAHQGDTLDYQNLIGLDQHAVLLSAALNKPIRFVDDVAGPAARAAVRELKSGEILLLDNVRYLTEEVSTFLDYVKLDPADQAKTYLVRNLAPLADLYVGEAFAAAHRSAPSLVGFPEVLPTAGGRLFIEEFSAMARVKENPEHPCVFVLGGAKISDAFGMMNEVLSQGAADFVLTSGLTGEVMLLAAGKSLGKATEQHIKERGLEQFIAPARDLQRNFPDKLFYPVDFAVQRNGERIELEAERLPVDELIIDVGHSTVERYVTIINQAKTIFVNGPAGIYEQATSAYGTQSLWNAIADAPGYSVIGGGDSVAASKRFGVKNRMGYVCTSGGGLVRFLSGQELPVVTALRAAAKRWQSACCA
jgi:phosphoglycerate kinase